MLADSFPLWGWLLPLLFGSPWIAAIAWFLWHGPRDDTAPPSTAEQARQRLWTD